MAQEFNSPIRKRLIAGALAVGTVLGAAGVANAVTSQDDTSTPTTAPDPTTDPTQPVPDDDSTTAEDESLPKGADDDVGEVGEVGEEHDADEAGEHGERGDHDGGQDETPLTGDIAVQVTTAAEAAVPGGTVTKVEQDDSGYEAHVTDADGVEVEVHFDQDLVVVEIEQDH